MAKNIQQPIPPINKNTFLKHDILPAFSQLTNTLQKLLNML